MTELKRRKRTTEKAYTITQYNSFLERIYISKKIYKTFAEAVYIMQEMIIKDLKSLDDLDEKQSQKALYDAIHFPEDTNFCECSSPGNAKVYFQKNTVEYIVYQVTEI